MINIRGEDEIDMNEISKIEDEKAHLNSETHDRSKETDLNYHSVMSEAGSQKPKPRFAVKTRNASVATTRAHSKSKQGYLMDTENSRNHNSLMSSDNQYSDLIGQAYKSTCITVHDINLKAADIRVDREQF